MCSNCEKWKMQVNHLIKELENEYNMETTLEFRYLGTIVDSHGKLKGHLKLIK